MSYHTYTTQAFIFHGSQLAEHDALFSCLTEEFGLIRARATGARKEDSKLRYALQAGSYTTLSLVKGRAGWRVTGAVLKQEPPHATISLFARLAKLTERLVQGEEKNEALFAVFGRVHTAEHSREELLYVIQVLISLGYIAPHVVEVIESLPEKERLSYLESHRPVLLKTVNTALESSHL